MTQYAVNTSVSVSKSKAEIEKILTRYGATRFGSGWDELRAFIAFEVNDRHVKFVLTLPDKGERRFWWSPSGRNERTQDQAHEAWEQGCRQHWRALALCIKGKLEAVECGITEFEDEFLAHIVLPDGQTAGQYLKPQIALAYERGTMPVMLPYLEE